MLNGTTHEESSTSTEKNRAYAPGAVQLLKREALILTVKIVGAITGALRHPPVSREKDTTRF